VLVEPGDVIVGDGDGVVVIPPPLLSELLDAAEEQELTELFITEQVAAGASIDGLYPLGPPWQERFETWRSQRAGAR
jgi:regulator of RNase E activity RraA